MTDVAATAVQRAVDHLIGRILHDPRVAWYFDPHTRSMELLSEAYAELHGLDVEAFRREFYPRLRFEEPAQRA